jgi:SAM-dependent methyltransferase
MLDAAQTVDVLKLRFYCDWMYQVHIYDEGESGFHKQLTEEVVKKYIDPLEMPKDAHILDLGCGPGYFLDEMKTRGYTNTVGVTLSPGDIKLCEEKGHTVKKYDLSFLPQSDGYTDESVDFIFLRHALEHSPFPMITLIEYNRVLRQGGMLYIEVPQPDCDRRHELNPNHYSIFGASMLAALLDRAGFTTTVFNNLEFDLGVQGIDKDSGEKTDTKVREKFYCIMATKTRALDIK